MVTLLSMHLFKIVPIIIFCEILIIATAHAMCSGSMARATAFLPTIKCEHSFGKKLNNRLSDNYSFAICLGCCRGGREGGKGQF